MTHLTDSRLKRDDSRLRGIGIRGSLLILLLCGAPSADQPLVRSVDAVAMTVSDMPTAVSFYRDVLTFEQIADIECTGDTISRLFGLFGTRVRIVTMRLGTEQIELQQFLTPPGRPIPADSRSNDRWFQHIAIIVRDMDSAYHHLMRHHLRYASTGPQRLPDWNPNAGGIEAFYFTDPDGHPLEILAFPKGKGAERWHAPTDKLFLGIDHTAIVVWDTEASLAFYRDLLGMRVAGGAENYGTEQEHLNNVFGARLRITSFTADKGMAIEFLEYLAPRDGRPIPLDTKPSDLVHRHIRLGVHSMEAAEQTALRARIELITAKPAAVSSLGLPYGSGMLVKDPDGHVLNLSR